MYPEGADTDPAPEWRHWAGLTGMYLTARTGAAHRSPVLGVALLLGGLLLAGGWGMRRRLGSA